MKPTPASILTQEVLKYLKANNHFAFRVNNIPAAKYRRGNLMKGIPDILGITNKKIALAIEIKTTDRQSTDQIQFEKGFIKAGGIYILAHSLDDVKRILEG